MMTCALCTHSKSLTTSFSGRQATQLGSCINLVFHTLFSLCIPAVKLKGAEPLNHQEAPRVFRPNTEVLFLKVPFTGFVSISGPINRASACCPRPVLEPVPGINFPCVWLCPSKPKYDQDSFQLHAGPLRKRLGREAEGRRILRQIPGNLPKCRELFPATEGCDSISAMPLFQWASFVG